MIVLRNPRLALLDSDEFAAWLRLLETPGVGRDTARRLLAAFGSPQAVLSASPAALRSAAGAAITTALSTEPAEFAARLAAARAWLAGPRSHVITLGDALYPMRLLQSADPPLLLYLQGRIELLACDAVAVVGSRHPSAQGRDNARSFGAGLSQAGLTVVSGLALGIDGAAHEGALGANSANDANGSTIAVVGTGLDIVYPARHRELAQRISEQGLMVSEYAPGTPPLAENFPQRNRIIAGLSLGTVVVEAALRSGSLITARLALESGREVYAVPGSIHAAQSRGCHELIRQGARLVEGPQEIADELRGMLAPRKPTTKVEPSADALLELLGSDPVSLDALIARTGEAAQTLSARLLELELDGAVARLPGGLYQRRFAA